MSPVFAHGNLRLYLLSLLAERPRHGYELIQALSDRFGGTYSPSAGTIYPRLSKLEDEGLVTKSSDGRKTVYAITDAGRAELANRAEELNAIEDELSDSVRRLADDVRSGVSEAMKSLRAELASAAREAKQHAREEPVVTPRATDQRTSSRVALYEIERLLGDFRREVRADLRSAVASGRELSSQSVAAVRDELARARDTFRSL